jgi:hypothetical protein
MDIMIILCQVLGHTGTYRRPLARWSGGDSYRKLLKTRNMFRGAAQSLNASVHEATITPAEDVKIPPDVLTQRIWEYESTSAF